ncbi:MAG: gliding motility-associated C-terminal domain-containing protein [Bacteroidales bacterium]|nr:gliding motility-associated C-terminal domain-containing protein [Bacteroidales bacterium]
MRVKIKNFLVLLIISFSVTQVFSQPGCVGVTITTNGGNDITLPCNEPCITLEATTVQTSGATTTYEVTSIPYNPPYPYTGGTLIPVYYDDDWSPVINIPNFHFCFFSQPYDNLIIGDNGVISFNTAAAGGFCPWTIDYGIPCNYGSPMHIFGAFHDTYLPAGGNMYWSVEGTTPCRAFVFKFNQVAHYSCNSIKTTQQIVLYETTNMIDVYIQSKPVCWDWNDGYAVVGIQDQSQSIAYTAPGRNATAWTATNEAWRFTPVGSSYVETYWYEGTNLIGTGTTVNVCPTGTTTYTARANYNTCWGAVIPVEDNITVTMAGGSVSLSPTDPTICNGESIQITASGSDSYVWAPATGLNQTTGSTVTASPTTTTTYTVTGSTPLCTASNTITVTVNPLPNILISPPGGYICIGDSLTMTASGADTYVWSPDNSLTTTFGPTVTAYPQTPVTYTITGTDTNQCVNTTTATVVASNGPTIMIMASPEDICPGDTSTLTVYSAAQIYTWQPGISLSSSTGPIVEAFPLTTTTYTVTADNNGCTSTETYTLEVKPLPLVDFTADVREGCAGFFVHFTDLTIPDAISWAWNFGDIIPYGNTSILQNPAHYYADAGSFGVGLTATSSNGCKMRMYYPDFITVYPKPIANFAANPQPVNELEPLVWFADQSIGATIWNWYFGDYTTLDNNSNAQNSTHVYSDTGTFYPVLIVFNSYGCSDTIIGEVTVVPNITFYVPNAFTPNNDAKNQVFKPQGEGIDLSSFEMRIYDRWGRQVFHTRDMENGWEGKTSGNVQAEGVYSWIISYYDIRYKFHIHKGHVTLIY